MQAKAWVFWVVGGVVVLAAAGAVGLTLSQPKKGPAVLTSTVQVADIESTVMAAGTLEPSNVVDVGAQTSGQLTELDIKLGDHVTANQKIGEIDSAQLNNQLRQAQNTLNTYTTARASQQTQLAVAQANANRQATLQAAGYAAQKDIDTAQANLKQAQANVAGMEVQFQNAQLQVESAQNNLDKANVRAPIDGVVVEVVTNQGSTINNNQSTQVIARVAKLDQMTIKAQISEADIIKVRQGQAVYFTLLGDPDHRYYGKLRAVEFTPSSGGLDPSKGSAVKSAVYYNALFDVPNPDGKLLPGMTAQVHVVLGEAKQVPTIPAAALGKEIAKDHYVVQVEQSNGQIVPRDVATGLTDQLAVEVKSGLKTGDKVVVGESAAPGASGGGKSLFSMPNLQS